MTFTATRHINHPAPTLLAILRDARTLATWNPALSPLRPADRTVVVGRPYRTLIRGVLPAVITFTRADETTIEYRMRALGAEERGSWLVEPIEDTRSRVTHTFTHSGRLLTALRRNFAPVAPWRLERLEHETTALSNSAPE